MTAPIDIELPHLDLSKYQNGNTGIAYLHRIDSGVPGPHAMITALVHGNEICGAIALDRLLRDEVMPARGALSLCFVNVEAYNRFDPKDPNASRFVDEDMNRVWAEAVLEGDRNSSELSRARDLREYVDTVDFLLDIHSMDDGPKPLALSGPLAKGMAFATKLGVPEIVVADSGHAAGVRLRDYGAFGRPESAKNAVLIECGAHWRRGTDQVAIDAAYQFLAMLEVVDAVPEPSVLRPSQQKVVRVTDAVTVRSDSFRFTEKWVGLEVIPSAGTTIAFDGDSPVKSPYDNCVLIMPVAKPKKGKTGVRLGTWVEAGD